MTKKNILRKDKMSQQVKEKAHKELHLDCYTEIINSPATTPLIVGCHDCRDKYKEISLNSKSNKKNEKNPLGEKLEFGKLGTKKFLYFRNVELERKNALLEKENYDLKLEIEKLRSI